VDKRKIAVTIPADEMGRRNGRVYPPEVLEKAVNDPKFQERIRNREMLGNLQDVTHLVTRADFKEGVIEVDLELLPDTPKSRELKELFAAIQEGRLGARGYTIGSGTVEGGVVTDLELESFSIEAVPVKEDEEG